MKVESISLLEVIKRGDIEASLFTTFNATFPFYEDVVLRRLAAVGCRNNVLLADHRQCSLSYTSEATRPRLAGIAYTLVPMAVQGAFHPKLCLLAGKKKASVFVGSHNLTISGFGYNRELTNHMEFVGIPGSPARAKFADAWAVVRDWLVAMSGRLPAALLESAFSLDETFGRAPPALAVSEETNLITQFPGRTGLLDQVGRTISEPVKQITVLGAFFDRDGAFLAELLRRWPAARVIVGVDPETVWFSDLPSDNRLRIVDARKLRGSNGSASGYLHAKAIYFESLNGQNLFLSGSANPSAPAWLSAGQSSNVEAMLMRFGEEADSCARSIGLKSFASLPDLTSTELQLVGQRSRLASDSIATAPPVLVGIANHAQSVIAVDLDALAPFDEIVAFSETDAPLASVVVEWTKGGMTRISGGLDLVRTLIVRVNGTTIARVIVHHAGAIARRVQGAAREPTVELLRRLGSAVDDISRVLPLLEKVIFSDSVPAGLRLPSGHTKGRKDEQASERPASLEISAFGLSGRRRPSLFVASNDLAYLIEILANHIQVADDAPERGRDQAGRTEEEQIGQDDEDKEEDPAEPLRIAADDEEIAESVCRRSSKLCNRMAKALSQRGTDPEATTTLLVQLVAVLALLQELEHLALADRWRRAHLQLLWLDDLETLFDAAADALFSPGDESLRALIPEGQDSPEELRHLVSLMLWLARVANKSWSTPTAAAPSTEDRADLAVVNGRLLGLLSRAGVDEETWEFARRHIERTLPADPRSVLTAGQWLERHRALALRLSTLPENETASQQSMPFLQGDIVCVPNVIEAATVVIDYGGHYVSVFAEKGKIRSFQTERVITLARI